MEDYFFLPTAVVAERLWSQKDVVDLASARMRLQRVLERLWGRERTNQALRFHERDKDNNGEHLKTAGKSEGQ
jgi:hypothetical protein